MAAEVPVCDVLCEAMEYLARLGSNLRTRSESLKEKKIRKDRLKNSHAVQKAAQKVLMICELSKKSLENVEDGVKKALAIVDSRQRSAGDGGNKSDRFSKSSKSYSDKSSSETYKEKHLSSPRRISISGKSYNLKIPRRISVKHYMSVKVLAKPMPKSMVEKYPVYFNCKLYRERMRKSWDNSAERSSSDNQSASGPIKSIGSKRQSDSSDVEEVTMKHVDKDGDSLNGIATESSSQIREINDENMQSSIADTNSNKEESNDKQSKKKDSEMGHTKRDEKESKTDQHSDEIVTQDTKSEKHSKEGTESETYKQSKGRRLSSSDEEKQNRNKKHKRDEQESKIDQNSDEKVMQDSKSEKHSKERTESEVYKQSKGRRLSSSDEENQNRNKKCKRMDESSKKSEKKFKKIQVIDTSSSENDEVKNKEANDSISLGDEIEKITPSEISLNENKENYAADTERKEEHEGPISQDKEKTQEDMVEQVKPLIKCVSLSKLLKPDVLEKTDKPKNKPSTPLNKSGRENSKLIVHMSTKGELKTKYVESNPSNTKSAMMQRDSSTKKMKKVRYQDEEEYWEQKRKEVKAFVPKTCTVKVVRLPKFSESFLNQNDLKRVTCGRSVLCELSQLNAETKTSSTSTNAAKHALLNDSDGDTIGATPAANETENIKISLLESDSDKNEDQEKQKSASPKLSKNAVDETDKVKSSLLEDSESDKNEKQEKHQSATQNLGKNAVDKTNKVKSSLLEDSESNKNEDQEKHQSASPKRSKNTVDETDKVKSSLLEDSESESEDQENHQSTSSKPSKDAIDETNNIKSSLLEDSKSDKNDNQQKKQSSDLKENSGDSESNQNENNGKTRAQSSNENAADKNKNVKSILLEESDKDEGEEKNKNCQKSSLLDDSCDSVSKSEGQKKHGTGVKSRRKHIMESMHAKKMLLTYSSSSDTEDEQLKNVIKTIKDDLMKSIEDDEEKTNLKKRIQSTSDSDEDILRNPKKKKKIGNESPKSQDSDKEDVTDNGEKNDSTRSQDVDKEEVTNNDKKKAGSGESSDMSHKSKSSTKKMGRSKEKPGDSSNQNSDSQDDKDIKGLTNLKTLSKTRRRGRRDSDSESEKTSTRRSSRKMAKAPQVFTENFLSPESSDDGSGAESDGPEEDLPPVTLSGLNGSALEHLAKDDLLDESESDTSKDKSSQDIKKEDDSDSSTVKRKRRKGQTISSDSEAGSSRRRKDADVKISDFEDSEDESSDAVKRAKRKKKGSDSDASATSSRDERKKKRKRIKELDSDEGSGSDSENEGKNKHGRKNIRKVMGKSQLEEATKKAAREEKERLARIAERQKMYNNVLFDESGKPDEVIVDKVVLDFDPETKEPLIEVDRGLVKKLKPHQANGIKFMWDACFESVKRIKKDKGSGCILAHCMGLGKTLQVVSLTHTLLANSELTKTNRVLVVCPLSTVLNWVNEFKMWLKHAENEPDLDVYELSRYKQNNERAFQLSQWFAHGGVCVLGYEMFRNLSADNPKKFKKKMLKQFQESLVDPGPDLVVCDEGHLLKNEKTSLSQSMNRVRTQRRIVLTGTPLQNNLKEYYCMVQFVKPNLLGKYNEYLNRFVNPITNGQYTDSTEYDIRIMKRRSHVLHKMLDGAVQRRDYGVLAPFLPPKNEYVLFITLTDIQIKLYQHYLDNYSRRPLAGKSSGFLFPDFQSLQRIWTHPLVLKYNSERYEIMQQKKRDREEEDSEGSLVDFIDDESTPDESSTEESSDDLSDVSDDSRKKSKKKKSAKKSKTKENKGGSKRTTRANPVDLVEEIGDPSILEVKNDNPTEWWIPLVQDDELEDLRNSHKLVLLFEILRQCEAIGDKLLVFSQSLYSLDLIEHFLGKIDEATQEGRIDEKLGNHVGSWSPGIDYFRLDGSTSCENRSIWCKNFNREDNPRARLFLISTRAGGLGINLVAANRVVIFDVSWNPSHDVQSIFRVYRFGQKKPCYIYRFLAMGTMEEKIYERQVTKQAISKRVIDEQQIDRHYAENDLAELYKFEPTPPAPRPVPLVPKDRLFAEMLKEHEAVIYKFHEHDSLLENKEEETLSEEERKAAWEDFENEKNRPPPQPFPSWPMQNGMPNMNLMAAQQQQLAYAALAGMLRKDMPSLTDDNIRQMLPMLYASNPAMFGGYDFGLMQKLSDMYKYSQPGMMNPQMMNMNAGSGGGGSSGLQYEPPWQRQQQQQQQMRLQQLMQQQQNSMGAKYYAGGLGSRDPVAMAMQQQRAREIMLGGGSAVGGAGRPRGRPPLQPRAPSTATNDVVNLDSD